MKIFITGSSGFIGKNLIPRLIKEGHEIYALYRKKPERADSRVRIVIGNLEEPKTFMKYLNRCDLLVHLAAIKTNWGREQDIFPLNSQILKSLIVKHSRLKHLIITSSVYALGELSHLPANEEHPLQAKDVYGKSKILLENTTKTVSKQHNIPYTIIRPALVYGTGDSEIGFMTKLIKMIKNSWFPLIGGGNNLIHLIFIDDLIDAYIKIVQKRPKNETIILAGPKPIKLRTLIELIEKVLGVKTQKIYIPLFPILMLAYLANIIYKTGLLLNLSFSVKEPILTPIKLKILTSNWHYNISKAKKMLNFNPKTDYEAGLKKLIKSNEQRPRNIQQT